MAVLPHLRDQHARLAALAPLEGIDTLDNAGPALIALVRTTVDALHRIDVHAMPAEGILHRKADFAQRAALPRAVHGQRQQIALAFRAVAQRIQRGLRLRLVPRRPRSEERRVGKEWVRTCSSRWSPSH